MANSRNVKSGLFLALILASVLSTTNAQAPRVSSENEEILKERREHAQNIFFCTTAAGYLVNLIPSVLSGDINTAKISGLLGSTYTVLKSCESYKNINALNKECGSAVSKLGLIAATILSETLWNFNFSEVRTQLGYLK